jgi:uncharacterized membrane protein
MLVKIFAQVWIIFGVLILIWPQLLRKRLQKKSFKKVKRFLFFLTLILGLALISASFKMQGSGAKIIAIIGLIGLVKAFLFLKAKAADKLIAWAANRPLGFFRLGGLAYVVIGIILLKFSN